MNQSSKPLFASSSHLVLPLLHLCCGVACFASRSPTEARASPAQPPATPTDSALEVMTQPPAEAPSSSAAAPTPVEPQGTSKEPHPQPTQTPIVPNWTFNGSDQSTGMMVLRCENAFPPDDHSGKCLCGGYELNVCVHGIRQLMIDRKQCMFICKPTSQSAKRVALKCPDATSPEASNKGCACSGRQPFNPCAGGIASARVTAGECVVTCKKDQ